MRMTPQERAAKVGETMFAADVAARETMGIEILSVMPGRAVLRMAVKPLHLNGHRICHGGFIFTLAYTTFAYGCNIEFLRPGHEGDVLTCEGVEQTLQGRHGIYDMKVRNQKGEVIAMFRGKSAVIPGAIFPEEEGA